MDQEKEVQKVQVALHAPNIVNICIDESKNGEMAGRLYHCYEEEPWEFANILQMVELMESLYDSIAFPQASTKTRSFVTTASGRKARPQKVKTVQDVAACRGAKGSFLTCVKYRQNSSWQGEVQWLEEGRVHPFISVLELLKILSNALEFGAVKEAEEE